MGSTLTRAIKPTRFSRAKNKPFSSSAATFSQSVSTFFCCSFGGVPPRDVTARALRTKFMAIFQGRSVPWDESLAGASHRTTSETIIRRCCCRSGLFVLNILLKHVQIPAKIRRRKVFWGVVRQWRNLRIDPRGSIFPKDFDRWVVIRYFAPPRPGTDIWNIPLG